MPRLIDYEVVRDSLTNKGLVCVYHNSGAFSFPPKTKTQSFGWLGDEDPSIRPEARPILRWIKPPIIDQLANLAEQAWQHVVGGPVWIMPKSHWAHELELGKRSWMRESLQEIGIDANGLSHRNTATAIEFEPGEEKSFHKFVESLLTNLQGSDFQMVFPHRATICTIHNHRQLWWTTEDETIATGLEQLVAEFHDP